MKLDSPQACMRALTDCVERGDLDGALSSFDEAATFINEEGKALQDRSAIRQEFYPFLSAKGKRSLVVHRIIEVGSDLAVVYLEWSAEIVDEEGNVVPNAGTGVLVLRRRGDDTWRVVFDDPNRSHHEH